MATSDTLLNLPGNRSVAKDNVEGRVVRKAYIDTSTYNLASGTYYRLFYYAADTVIVRAAVITDVVEGAAETTDVTDDESGTTTLCSNADLNTANAIKNYSTGIHKASAGYVCVKPDAALTVTKFWVVAEFIPLSTSD